MDEVKKKKNIKIRLIDKQKQSNKNSKLINQQKEECQDENH